MTIFATQSTVPAIGPIKRGDRVLIVGTTGSGKSTLAGCLLAVRKHVVILDPKMGWTWPKGHNPKYGPAVLTSIAKVAVKHEGPNPLIYQPTLAECKSGLGWFWDWVWWRENTIVYIDEVFLIIRNAQEMYPGTARAIQQGRQRNISVWCATQRPARIPVPILSESEHHFVFRLRHPTDLRRMADYTSPEIESEPASGHDFWYYNDREQRLIKTNVSRMRVKEGR